MKQDEKAFLGLEWHLLMFMGSGAVALFMVGLLLFDLLFFRNWVIWVIAVPLLLLSTWGAWTAIKGLLRQ